MEHRLNQEVRFEPKQGVRELPVVAGNDKRDSGIPTITQSKRSPGSTIKPLLFIRQQLKQAGLECLTTIPCTAIRLITIGSKRREVLYQALQNRLIYLGCHC